MRVEAAAVIEDVALLYNAPRAHHGEAAHYALAAYDRRRTDYAVSHDGSVLDGSPVEEDAALDHRPFSDVAAFAERGAAAECGSSSDAAVRRHVQRRQLGRRRWRRQRWA